MTRTDRQHETRAEFLLLIVVLIWSSNYPLAKWALAGMNVFVFNAIRFVVSAGVVGVVFFSRSKWQPITTGDWSKLLQVGIVANVIYQGVFVIGLSMTSAGNSAILLSTAPLWTLLIGARMHKDRISPMLWMGMIVSLSGVAMIVIGSGKKLEFGDASVFGDLITLVAAMLWGLNTNLQKPILTRYSVLQMTLIMMCIGAAGLTGLAIVPAMSFDWMGISPWYYVAAITSGALSIAIANVMWSYGVKRLGPGRTSNFSYLVPVLALMFSFAFLGESIHAIQVIGMSVTIVGVWIARRFSQPKLEAIAAKNAIDEAVGA